MTFHPLTYFKFNLYATMTDSFDKQPSSSAAEIDEVKRMLVETNPILLITTIIVTILHGLFEILAFKVSNAVREVSNWALIGCCVRTISLIGRERRKWLEFLSERL